MTDIKSPRTGSKNIEQDSEAAEIQPLEVSKEPLCEKVEQSDGASITGGEKIQLTNRLSLAMAIYVAQRLSQNVKQVDHLGARIKLQS